MKRVVIIGAGQAGCQLAVSLREKNFKDDIVLLGDEGELPYQRPPLSKAFLRGASGSDALRIKPAEFFVERNIDFRADTPAESIDRSRREIALRSGETVSYDRLVLATGVRNRTITLPNADAKSIAYLRTRREAESLRLRMAQARSVVVIGAGFIGMEFAAVARQSGLDVTVIEQADRSMSRAVSKIMSSFIEARHRAEGVNFEFGAGIQGFEIRQSVAQAVCLNDGRSIPADLVLAAVGVIPNTDLAEGAGLRTRNGILVDRTLTTNDPAIHAIGDCAVYPHPLCGGREIRLESVQNASDQARFLASAIMGEATHYDSVPWFWSDQYDMKLQIAGVSGPDDIPQLSGDPIASQFSVRHSTDGRLTALETMNQAREHMLARNELKRTMVAMGSPSASRV